MNVSRNFLLAIAATTALLSGCMGTGGGDSEKEGQENKAPEAMIEAQRETGWTGDTFNFDASASKDPDGRIEQWRFDFGDGTTMDVTNEEDAREISHKYLKGGEYRVTLTVMDDGGETAGSLSDTDSVRVGVNERTRIATQVIHAAPGNASEQSAFRQPFDVTADADRAEAALTVRNSLPVGSSEVTVQLVDPDGDVMNEETLSVPAGAERGVEVDSDLGEAGTYHLVVRADSGGSIVEGELRVFYDENF